MARITTPFGFRSTAQEVVEGIDLSGKRAIVTGAGSGIGVETARALALAGAEVTMAVRKWDPARSIASELSGLTGATLVHVSMLDLDDPVSIASFVDRWDEPLDILINNAGVMALPETRDRRGIEQQFATNHLGHFALALGLHDALAAADSARIVAVSSNAHLMSPVVFDDINFDYRAYDPWLSYGQSKTANILFAVGATAYWEGEGITANALNPGAIATNLQRHVGGMRTPVEKRKTPAQGAATTVLLATSPLLEGIGGRYFEDCNEAKLVERRDPELARGVAPYALDADNADRLWDASLRMLL